MFNNGKDSSLAMKYYQAKKHRAKKADRGNAHSILNQSHVKEQYRVRFHF